MLKNPLVMFELVERVSNFVRAELRRIGAEHGLQPVHVQALIYLSQANRYSNTPQALTEYLGLTKGTVSQSLLLLDRRGLIERYQDELDRRVVRLRLSSQGEAFLSEAQPTMFWLQATRNISANRIRNGVSALRETLGEIQATNGARTFGVCGTCAYCQRKSQRVYHCGWFGERLSVPDMGKICREHSREGAEE